jgi:hypothetical protein
MRIWTRFPVRCRNNLSWSGLESTHLEFYILGRGSHRKHDFGAYNWAPLTEEIPESRRDDMQ